MSDTVDKYLDEIQNVNEFILITSVLIISMAIKMYKNHISKYGKHCKERKGDARKLCILNGKIKATEEFIVKLRTDKHKCSDNKCKEKVESKVKNVKKKLDNIKDKQNSMSIKLRGF